VRTDTCTAPVCRNVILQPLALKNKACGIFPLEYVIVVLRNPGLCNQKKQGAPLKTLKWPSDAFLCMYRGGLKQCGNSTLRCPPQIFWHRPIAPLSSHLILILPFCAERPTVNYRKLELLLHQRCHRRDPEFSHLGPLLQLSDWDHLHLIVHIFSSARAFSLRERESALKEFGKWCLVSNSVMHLLRSCNESGRDFPRLDINNAPIEPVVLHFRSRYASFQQQLHG